MSILRFFSFISLIFIITISVQQANAIEIKEWKVPYEKSRPRDPFVDQKGRVWFCGQKDAYIAYLDPKTGDFKKFDLGEGEGPHNLLVDNEGFIWYAANLKPYIGKLDPDTGDIIKYQMPDGVPKDPHTMVFNSEGDIWFTAQWGNYISKLNTKTGEVMSVEVPIERARPYGIKMDSNNHPWVVLFGTNKIATVDPETMALKMYDINREDARPRRLVITKDGHIWYVDYAKGMLGKFNISSKTVVKEWQLPGGERSHPYGMVKDHNDKIWLVEVGGRPNRFVGFDPITEKFTSVTEIPASAGAVRHMYYHSPSREIWFGEDSDVIARVRVP